MAIDTAGLQLTANPPYCACACRSGVAEIAQGVIIDADGGPETGILVSWKGLIEIVFAILEGKIAVSVRVCTCAANFLL